MNGLILDIHRCSLHDGPGIRTTVFLKGCPLHCVWCHNPESQSFKKELSFFEEHCCGCGACASICSCDVHQMSPRSLDRSLCTFCGKCVAACPEDAIEVKGRKMTVDQVLDTVLKDRVYYEESSGGLTVSGGEPMAQFEFTNALLCAAKSHGIHTCIETCGYAAQERFEEILPAIDLFLFDIKGVNDEKHVQHTGVSTRLIHENLDFLIRRGARVQLRCPLVPGMNDSDADLKGLAELYRKYADALTGIEIMPYHCMGEEKGRRVGKANLQIASSSASEEQKTEWLDALAGYGCPVI